MSFTTSELLVMVDALMERRAYLDAVWHDEVKLENIGSAGQFRKQLDAAISAEAKLRAEHKRRERLAEAARAMLAALKAVRDREFKKGGWGGPCWDMVDAAIAQAEAAGIKAED